MKREEFFDQYKDPRWQKKRLEIMERDEFSCQCCYETESELNVHHRKYIKDKKIWEYNNDQLVTLCDNCHKEVHITKDRINDLISDIPEIFLDKFLDILPSIISLDPGKQHALKEFINSLFPKNKNGNFYD